MQTMVESNYLTTDEVAKRMKVSRQSVIQLIASGDLPATRFGRLYRILEEDLEAYLQSNYTKSDKKIEE